LICFLQSIKSKKKKEKSVKKKVLRSNKKSQSIKENKNQTQSKTNSTQKSNKINNEMLQKSNILGECSHSSELTPNQTNNFEKIKTNLTTTCTQVLSEEGLKLKVVYFE
jgi:hypothetical protein